VGVALAEAMTVNKTLRTITLSAQPVHGRDVHKKATLGAQTYETFSAMLRINTSAASYEASSIRNYRRGKKAS
jgi:hypothetical protein